MDRKHGILGVEISDAILVNSLHAEMVCSLPFINTEINVISPRSK